MTVLDRMLELARQGYSVTIGDNHGYGIVVGVSKGIVRLDQAYSFYQLDLGILSTDWFIMDTIDKMVGQLDRKIAHLDSVYIDGEGESK